MHEDQPSHPPSRTWCQWHQGYTTTGRMVAAIEQGSGAGLSIYACEPCRQENKLKTWEGTGG